MIDGTSRWAPRPAALADREVDGRRERVYEDAAPSLYAQLKATAARTPQATAIVEDGGSMVSYAELLDRVDCFAGRLFAQYRIEAGDRVALLMRATADYVVSLYAINRIGAVCVAIPTKYRVAEAVSLMFASDPALVIAGPEFQDWAPSFPVEPERVLWGVSVAPMAAVASAVAKTLEVQDEAAPALMMFTSGTTSASKGVVLCNYNLVHAAMVYAHLMGTTPEDKTVVCLPIYYVTGLVALVAQFIYVGATIYLHRLFDPERLLCCVEDEGITYLHCSPTAFAKILECRPRHPSLPSLRQILSGSSHESPAVMSAYHEWLPQTAYTVVYGLTETSSPALLFPGDTAGSSKQAAAGVPVPGVEAKIMDPSGQELATGEVGELWLRGTNVTRGYYRRDDPSLHEDGWFQTGDLAFVDEDGVFWVVDRIKDMINRGGEKVWCSSLEDSIDRIEGVRQSCVSRIPDETYGEVPVAAVVREQGSEISQEEILAVLAPRVARYELPEHLVFLDEIPLTKAEKPDRTAVTEAVLAIMEGR